MIIKERMKIAGIIIGVFFFFYYVGIYVFKNLAVFMGLMFAELAMIIAILLILKKMKGGKEYNVRYKEKKSFRTDQPGWDTTSTDTSSGGDGPGSNRRINRGLLPTEQEDGKFDSSPRFDNGQEQVSQIRSHRTQKLKRSSSKRKIIRRRTRR